MSINRLSDVLEARNRLGRSAFIPFLIAGDPSSQTTIKAAQELARGGADIIEIGVPFSDPVADGPVIQAAGQRALARGMSLTRAAAIVASLRRKRVMTPAILFTYLNPILRLGAEGFARLCARNGVDAALIVDLPVEECEKYSTALTRHGCELVLLASPTTTDARLREIGRASGSIIYYVSREGVTGVRAGLAPGLAQRLKHVRKVTGKPLIVGFGVATADQAHALADHAEGVVVGSALVSTLAAAGATSGPAVVAKLARSLVSALERA